MRRVVFLACLLACADYRRKPTFPEDAAHRPVVNEQSLLGLSPGGDALAAQLVDADGEPPQLWLAVFDARGGPTRKILQAPDAVARTVSRQLQEEGETPRPVLERLVRTAWPEAGDKVRALGFAGQPETLAPPGSRSISVPRAAQGNEPLLLRTTLERGPPRMVALTLSDETDEVELARMPISGELVGPQLYVRDGVAWMLSGSVRKGAPLHRAVGLRRANLHRGEAQIDNLRGLDAMAAGDLNSARSAFEHGIAADPGCVDVLYNAASVAALMNDDTAAVALLARAAAVDPARVQVLGRSDPSLHELRKRKDVLDLLGQHRAPPDNASAPP